MSRRDILRLPSEMRPSKIGFKACDFFRQFSDGRDILDVFRDLVRGHATPDSLGPITVVLSRNGSCNADSGDGNRLLLLYKVDCFVYIDGGILKIDFTDKQII